MSLLYACLPCGGFTAEGAEGAGRVLGDVAVGHHIHSSGRIGRLFRVLDSRVTVRNANLGMSVDASARMSVHEANSLKGLRSREMDKAELSELKEDRLANNAVVALLGALLLGQSWQTWQVGTAKLLGIVAVPSSTGFVVFILMAVLFVWSMSLVLAAIVGPLQHLGLRTLRDSSHILGPFMLLSFVLIPFHIAEAVKCAGRLRVECSIQSQAVSDRTRPGSDSSSPRYASTASIFSSMLPYVLPSTHLRTSWKTRSAGFNSGLYGGWMMVASPTLRTISPR